MKRYWVTMIAMVIVTPALAETAEEMPKIESTILAQSTEAWNGVEVEYPEGQAQITVSRVIIPKGASTPMHCHPVPLAGSVIKGKLKVATKVGEAATFEEGDGVVEVMNTWHQGTALEDTELIVVYAGALGLPTSVMEDGDPELTQYCK